MWGHALNVKRRVILNFYTFQWNKKAEAKPLLSMLKGKDITEGHLWRVSLKGHLRRGIFEGHLWRASLKGIIEGHLWRASMKGSFEGHIWRALLEGIFEGHLWRESLKMYENMHVIWAPISFKIGSQSWQSKSFLDSPTDIAWSGVYQSKALKVK